MAGPKKIGSAAGRKVRTRVKLKKPPAMPKAAAMPKEKAPKLAVARTAAPRMRVSSLSLPKEKIPRAPALKLRVPKVPKMPKQTGGGR